MRFPTHLSIFYYFMSQHHPRPPPPPPLPLRPPLKCWRKVNWISGVVSSVILTFLLTHRCRIIRRTFIPPDAFRLVFTDSLVAFAFGPPSSFSPLVGMPFCLSPPFLQICFKFCTDSNFFPGTCLIFFRVGISYFILCFARTLNFLFLADFFLDSKARFSISPFGQHFRSSSQDWCTTGIVTKHFHIFLQNACSTHRVCEPFSRDFFLWVQRLRMYLSSACETF